MDKIWRFSGFWEFLALVHCHVANTLADSEKKGSDSGYCKWELRGNLARFQENAILRNDVKILETNPTSKR